MYVGVYICVYVGVYICVYVGIYFCVYVGILFIFLFIACSITTVILHALLLY